MIAPNFLNELSALQNQLGKTASTAERQQLLKKIWRLTREIEATTERVTVAPRPHRGSVNSHRVGVTDS